jgi:hypothetical protein
MMDDNETKRRTTTVIRRQNVEGCTTCKSYGKYGPMHDASKNCQSGQRSHCTCDTCF